MCLTELSDAVNAGMAKQTDGRLHPLLALWSVGWLVSYLPELSSIWTGRLEVFGNRVLRAVFGPERAEVTGGWRNLYTEEVVKLLYSQNIQSRIIP